VPDDGSCELKHVAVCRMTSKCFVGWCVSFVCNYCLLQFLKVATNPAAVWYHSNPRIHGKITQWAFLIYNYYH